MQNQLDHVRKALMRAQLPHAAQQGRAAASLPRRIRNTRGRPARDSGPYPNLAHNPIKLQISRLRGICLRLCERQTTCFLLLLLTCKALMNFFSPSSLSFLHSSLRPVPRPQ